MPERRVSCAVITRGVSKGLDVGGEDGFAPGDGDVFGSGEDEGDGRGVVAHGGAEGDEEAPLAGSDGGGGRGLAGAAWTGPLLRDFSVPLEMTTLTRFCSA